MKRILASTALLAAGVALLSGCSSDHGEGAPAPQSQPTGITNVQTQNLYKESTYDDNTISHWVFDQKMPDGTTITCVAARWGNGSNISISCPEPAITKK